MSKDAATDGLSIPLTGDEALVLYELPYRWSEVDEAPTPGGEHFESPAECVVLFSVLAQSEKRLLAPLQEDFGRQVAEARERLAPSWAGGSTLRD